MYTLWRVEGVKSWRLDIEQILQFWKAPKSIWSNGFNIEWMDTIDYNVYKLVQSRDHAL